MKLQRKGSLYVVLSKPCRLRGDIAQYDITDPEHPKLAGRVWLGGCCRKGGPYKVLLLLLPLPLMLPLPPPTYCPCTYSSPHHRSCSYP